MAGRHRWRATILALLGAFGVLLALGRSARGASPSLVAAAPPAWISHIESVEPPEESADTVSRGLRHLLCDHQVRVGPNAVESYWHWSDRIVNESGLQSASQVTIEFDPTYQQLRLHSLTIRRDGQAIDHLDIASARLVQREPNLEAQVYDGRQSALLFVSDLRVGDVVDYEYTLRGSDPTLEGTFTDTFLLAATEAIGRLRTRLVLSGNRHVSIAALGHDSSAHRAPSIASHAGETEYIWDELRVPSVAVESDTPSWYDPLPFVRVSEFESWHDVATWGTRMFQTAPPASAIREWVKERLGESSSPDDFLLTAIRFVQDQVRYVGIEVGMARRRPSNPKTVFDRRYGDCKEKAALLVAILGEAGIRAWPALVSSRGGRTLDDALPSPAAFDHVIVKVAGAADQSHWVDPTQMLQGGGIAAFASSIFERALVLDASTTGLERLDLAPPAPTALIVLDHFRVGDPNKSNEETSLDSEREYQGGLADTLRAAFKAGTRNELEHHFLGLYEKSYPSIRQIAPLEHSDDRDRNTVRVAVHFSIPQFWMWQENERRHTTVVDALALDGFLQRPAAGRASPFALPYPMRIECTIDLLLPQDIPFTPVVVTRESAGLRFRFELTGGPQKLSYDYHLETKTAAVAVADLAGHADVVDKAREVLSRRISIGVPGANGPNWPVIAFLGVAAAIAGWIATRMSRYEPRRANALLAPASDSGPPAFRGWLGVLGINLAIGPFYRLRTAYRTFGFVGWLVPWHALTRAASSTYEPWLAGLLVLETVTNLWFAFYGAAIFVLYITKRRRFVFHLTIAQVGLVCFAIADAVAAHLVNPRRPLSSNTWSTTVGTILGCCVWVSYVRFSRRSASTFVR